MNYIETLRHKKKKYLTKEEKFFLSEVSRFETLEKVYMHRLEFLKFNFDTQQKSKCIHRKTNIQEDINKCQKGLDYIRLKLEEFNQR